MNLAPQKSRSRESELTPLINVVFLMLIFVVLAGEVVENAPFAVDPPQAGDSGPASEPFALFVGADGRIAVGGRVIAEPDIGVALADLRERSRNGEILVEADRGADATGAIDLIARLSEAGFDSVRLVTAPGAGR